MARVVGLTLALTFLSLGWSTARIQVVESFAQASNQATAGDEGEIPRTHTDEESTLKKRRNQLAQDPSEATPPAPTYLLPVSMVVGGLHEFTEVPRHQQHADTYRLILSDPSLRLHPGHAPPAPRADGIA
ncbi:MAG: hypothetical protein EOP02_09475 [Proteobacteria bacterium]|nr:MAG: hypothetical protein EOP02_09475 [Pseudomonadota bacterium]